ncbi:MAG: phenylalanine--tRNA ligase subunit beta, partial [Parachlamydiales bacterium]
KLENYLHDPVLELSLTPNLGHCLSALGIARELGAALNQKVRYPDTDFSLCLTLKTSSQMQVQLKDESCRRYSGLYLENLTVAPSPGWLAGWLKKSGFKPINNIVDILNFVLLETGQPLHGFDADKIQKRSLTVGKAQKESPFLGLDGLTHTIPQATILIEDEKGPLVLAGILGGADTAVSEETKKLFLEAASFDPLAVRKSCRALQLRTESSNRFEKGTDPNATIKALKRAAHLIQKLIPEVKIASDFIDLKKTEFPPKTILLEEARVNQLLGLQLSFSEIAALLERLELKVQKTDGKLSVSVPTFRLDLKEPIDLIEEIARLFGYNNIERKRPYFTTSSVMDAPFYIFEEKLKKNLIAQGLKEIITPDLISLKLARLTAEKEPASNPVIEVKKAKSQDNSILRSTLLSSHLEVLKDNQAQKNFDCAFFELSKLHFRQEKTIIEEPVLALVLSGKKEPRHFLSPPSESTFFDLKGLLENLLSSLRLEHFSYTASHHSSFHPHQQAHLLCGQAKIATFGRIHPKLTRQMDLKDPVFFAEINTHLLFQFQKAKSLFVELPAFPASERDWTFAWDREKPVQLIFDELKKLKSRQALLEKYFLLDLYQDEKKHTLNLTLRFVYRDRKKTVLFEEVDKTHSEIMKTITEKFLSS